MPKIDVFTNQTTNDTVIPQETVGGQLIDLVVNGFCQIDIAGVLAGADLTMQYLHSNSDLDEWVPIVDSTWLAAADPVPVLPDGSLIQIDSRKVRFVLSNIGETTDISVSISYD